MSRSIGGYLVLAWVLACAQEPPPSEGSLEVSWAGKDSGSISGSANARWCALRRVLEVQTIQGDTGIALALYPGQSVVPGNYPVLESTRAESLPPAAAVALRWLGPSVVQGFRGDSGRVVLERTGEGRFSGRLSSRARSVVDTQRITLTGSFRDLVVRPDSLGCTAPEEDVSQDADPADTGVH